MLPETNKVQIPSTEAAQNGVQVEKTSLQMEELEPRVAPNIAWGT